jgi:hypothetical protein
VTGTSPLDGVHLDANQHGLLGKALAKLVVESNMLLILKNQYY